MMGGFESVSILLPTLNETFSFRQTVEIILDECNKDDICEIIAIVCERTKKESLAVISDAAGFSKEHGIELRMIYQTTPFAGGAVRDGIESARGSHVMMMAPDLETDPHTVKAFIEKSKIYPKDMITASRWIEKGSFSGYSRVKYVLNYIFQKMFGLFYLTKLTDITFGYRMAPTKLFQSIAWEEERHPFFLETALKPLRLGIKIHEIPSAWKAREEGESQNSLLQTFKYLRIAFKVKFERRCSLVRRGIDIAKLLEEI